MTDNRTTELLPCPFCGGEAVLLEPDKSSAFYRVGCNSAHCIGANAVWHAHTTEAEAVAAWNARAMGGTLTAEQVREAVMSADRWENPMGDTGLTNTHLIIRDDGWQAIADELNAELGSGTCEWLLEHSGTLYDKWRCSKCGYLHVESRTDGGATDFDPNFCPSCGRKVER